MAKGIIKLLGAMIASLSATRVESRDGLSNQVNEIARLQHQRNAILLNGRGSMPFKTPNQRQRRKLARQMNRY